MAPVVPLDAAALAGAGLVAGAINTLAGGGSLLTVPVLMLYGLPADVANATNRVPVLGQCLSGTAAFARGRRLPGRAAWLVVPPIIAGAAVGAWIATRVPNRVFEPILIATLVVMAVALVVDPRRWSPPADSEPRSARTPWALLSMFGAGVYGGALQAGTGLILLAILAGGLRYDLVRANALKALVMLLYIAVTVAVFAARGLIDWTMAGVVTAGSVVGAWAAAHLAMSPRGLAVTRIAVIVVVLALAAAVVVR